MKKITLWFLAIATLTAPALALAGAVPFMIIRFNQPHIYFESALNQAVAAALQAKPGAHFTLVSFGPTSQSTEQSAQHINAVSYAVRNAGVPDSNIHVQRNLNDTLQFDEIHILVE